MLYRCICLSKMRGNTLIIESRNQMNLGKVQQIKSYFILTYSLKYNIYKYSTEVFGKVNNIILYFNKESHSVAAV